MGSLNEPSGERELSSEPVQPSLVRTVVSFVLFLIGVSTIVGISILYFYLEANHAEPFPRAWRLVAFGGGFISLLIIMAATFLAGPRMVVRFGSITVVAGVGMFVFGYANLAQPSLRFFAPLGFFISLGGIFAIWIGRNIPAWGDPEARRSAP